MIVGHNMFYTFTFFDITLEEKNFLIETGDNYDINYSYNEMSNILIVYDVPTNRRNEFIEYANSNNIDYKQEIKEQTPEYTVFEYWIIPAFDFVQEMLLHSEQLEVLEPESLRILVKEKIARIADLYK